MNLDRRLLAIARTAVAPIALAIGFGLLVGILAIFQAGLLSRIISAVFLAGKDLSSVWGWLLVLLAVLLVRAAANFLGEWFASGAAARVKTDLREQIFKRVLGAGPVLVGDLAAGDLVATAIQGVEALDAYFSQFLPQLALAGLVPCAVLLVVFPFDPLSGLVLLVTGPLIPFFMFLIGKNSEKLTGRQFSALRKMSAYLLDTLQGLKTLKAMGRSQEQAGRIEDVSERYRKVTMEVLRVTFLSALVLELLGTLGTAIIAVQVGLRLLYGQMDFEKAFFLLVIAPDFYLPLRTLGLRFHASQSGVAAAQQIFALFQPAAVSIISLSNPVPPDWHILRFEQVSVRFPGREREALADFNLDLQRGELVALVGESGAGKTTAAQVLLGLVEPTNGSVTVDGQRLSTLDLTAWRQQVGWVPQRARFVHGSIRDVLRVANLNASENAMWLALEQAHLADWVRALPAKLDTVVGIEGSRISGGQMQRLALARAFLRDAPLLVLDEPTASLDPPEEALLEETVRRLCSGRTVLMIAHRLATVYRADRIVFMTDGHIIESGTHSDLVRTGGAYGRLVEAYGAK